MVPRVQPDGSTGSTRWFHGFNLPPAKACVARVSNVRTGRIRRISFLILSDDPLARSRRGGSSGVARWTGWPLLATLPPGPRRVHGPRRASWAWNHGRDRPARPWTERQAAAGQGRERVDSGSGRGSETGQALAYDSAPYRNRPRKGKGFAFWPVSIVP